MPIAFNCPSCGKGYNFNDDMGGKQGKCSCGAVINIPAASAPAPQMPPIGQPPAPQMPPIGQPPQQMPPMGQPPAPQMPPMGQPPQQMPPMGQPPMQQMPPMGQPPAPQMPPMGQPPQQMPPMGQPPMGQMPQQMPPPMGGSPYQTPMTGGGYAPRDPNSFSPLNFFGHQMYFWSQIAFIVGAVLGVIQVIMLMANEFNETLIEIAFYAMGAASAVCAVGLGFWIAFPRKTQCAGLMLTAFIVVVSGTALLWITYLAEVRSIVLPIIGMITYFTGGTILYVGLQKLCRTCNRQDAFGLATTGMVLNIIAGAVITFVLIALYNRWVPSSSPGAAKTVVVIYTILPFLLIGGIAGTTMGCFQRLKRTFQNR